MSYRLREIRFSDDGWFTERNLPGWEDFDVYMHMEEVDGQPRITSLHIDAHAGTSPRITVEKLRTLPLQALAISAWTALNEGFHPRFQEARERIESMGVQKHDPRAQTTIEHVAEVWNSALGTPRPPREVVCEALSVSPRTADRYIARAREAGLITKQGHPARTEGKNTDERNNT